MTMGKDNIEKIDGYKNLKRKERPFFWLMVDKSRLVIDSVIKIRGPLPDYINQEDLFDFSYEQVLCMIFKSRPNLPNLDDLSVDLEHLLSETFYKVKARGGLSKCKPTEKEGKLQMNSQQMKMFEQYQSYVNTVIYKTINVKRLPSGVEYDDLHQLGLIALIRAIQSYDDKYDFLPYANRLIKNAVLDGISNYTDKTSDTAVSFNSVYDDGKSENDASDAIQGQAIKENPELFTSVDYDYEVKEMVESMTNIYDKLDEGCVKKGLDAIIKVKILNYSLTDYARSIGETPNRVGAYMNKAKSFLRTNKAFLRMIGRESL